jgi:hypothetical protein
VFPPAVLVFDSDGEAYAFRSLATAEGHLEMIDVLDGEYQGAFTTDGNVVVLSGEPDGPVSLTWTPDKDPARLAQLLHAAATRRGRPWVHDDPAAIAAELLHEDWEQRWPKRPRWLSRRLHGEEPPRP